MPLRVNLERTISNNLYDECKKDLYGADVNYSEEVITQQLF
jgi:hypothetical protein